MCLKIWDEILNFLKQKNKINRRVEKLLTFVLIIRREKEKTKSQLILLILILIETA